MRASLAVSGPLRVSCTLALLWAGLACDSARRAGVGSESGGEAPDAGTRDARTGSSAADASGTEGDAGPRDEPSDAEPRPFDPGPGPALNAGFIGGACASALDCSSPDFNDQPICLTDGFPYGMCTQACRQSASGSYLCPDTDLGSGTQNSMTRCVPDAQGQPTCVSQCDFRLSASGCREGYTCVSRIAYGEANHPYTVCLPAANAGFPGEPPPEFDIGEDCEVAADCAHGRCLHYASGYCSKVLCNVSGCPAGSTCSPVEGWAYAACLRDCRSNADCRVDDGFVCSRDGVCVAGPEASLWDPSVGPADCASAWGTNGDGLSPCDNVKDDYIVVRKSARNVALCREGQHVESFQGGLGFAPSGDKERQGDGRTPEGVFYVARMVPETSFHRAFLISYPDPADAARGLREGLVDQARHDAIVDAHARCAVPPQNTALGSELEIHGAGGALDWTAGCVAVDNPVADALAAQVGARDTIVILP